MRINFQKYNQENYLGLVLLHILMGFSIYAYNPIGKFIFLGLLVYFVGRIIIAQEADKTREVLLACAYFVGSEVLFRMTKSSISYEASKYLVILFMLIGIFYKGLSGKGYVYFIYLIILVPAVIMAAITLSFDAHFRTNIAFVLTGPVCLGIASLFCYDRKVNKKLLLDIMLYISLPVISLTTYVFFYAPSLEDLLTSTASNQAASGGFGPNQVATSLGLGMVALVVRIFLYSPSLGHKLINLSLFAFMTYRAFVTFSRGGVVAAVIVTAAFLWTIFWKSSSQQRSQILGSFILFATGVAVAWMISSSQTGGLLDLRYTNKDVLGRDQGELSTGRAELFIDEMGGFLSSPFLGVGASRTKDIRVEHGQGDLPSHNEIGRLLSEHGLLGIIALTILIVTPLAYRTRNKRNFLFYVGICFWFATINHSGMRIAAPAYLYALSLLNVESNNIKSANSIKSKVIV
ncbi:MAG: O-antigen ligase family protein [Gelidibacter sp.]